MPRSRREVPQSTSEWKSTWTPLLGTLENGAQGVVAVLGRVMSHFRIFSMSVLVVQVL